MVSVREFSLSNMLYSQGTVSRRPEETAREFVYRVLTNYINELMLRPGEKVMESNVAAQLGVSRTPVRATFVQLSREGMLDLSPHRANVPLLRISQIRQLCWMYRTTIEGVLGELFHRNLSHDAFDDLRLCVDEEYRALEGTYMVQMANLDREFYGRVFSLDERAPVYNAMHRAGPDLFRLYRIMEDRNVWHYIVDRHLDIVKALSARNYESAVRAMNLQFDLTEFILDETLKAVPQYFQP